MSDLSPRLEGVFRYGCRYAALVEVLAAIDHTTPGVVPLCDQPAVFATTVVRDRGGVPCPIHARTCVVHDGVFRTVAGYAGSVRLPFPIPVPAAREATSS